MIAWSKLKGNSSRNMLSDSLNRTLILEKSNSKVKLKWNIRQNWSNKLMRILKNDLDRDLEVKWQVGWLHSTHANQMTTMADQIEMFLTLFRRIAPIISKKPKVVWNKSWWNEQEFHWSTTEIKMVTHIHLLKILWVKI